MKKSKFTETQIIQILKEYDRGRETKDICRSYGIVYPMLLFIIGRKSIQAWMPVS